MKNVVGILALLLAGCAALAPQRDLSRFYTLSPRDTAVNAEPGRGRGLTVVVGPITIPAYLDRNEIAMRVSPTEVTYPPLARWAEPLATNFSRVLIDDLGAALGSDRVVGVGSSEGLTPDYWIEVVVMRFETATDGSAQLTARWAVRDAARKILRIRQTQHARQSTAPTTEGAVNALSAALGDLADEMAATLAELRAETPSRPGR